MAQFASDSFTGTSGTELAAYSANWTKHTASGSEQAVISDANRLRPNSSGMSLYYHSGTPAGADYEVSADFYAQSADGGDGNCAVTGRTSTSANTLYLAQYVGLTIDAWRLFKIVSGTATQLGSSVAQSFTAGTSKAVKLRMVGTTIELYKEGSGSPSVSTTDSAITAAGKAGLRVLGNTTYGNSVGLHLDTFSADDVSSGVSGTLAATLAGAVLAAAGAQVLPGAFASTLADAVLAASGSTFSGVSGTLASTLADAVLAASGAQSVPGSFASTLAGATFSASGSSLSEISGTFAATLAGAVMSASGNHAEPASGTFATQLTGATFSAFGNGGAVAAAVTSGPLALHLGLRL